VHARVKTTLAFPVTSVGWQDTSFGSRPWPLVGHLLGVPLFRGGAAPAVSADPSSIEAGPQSGALFLVLRRDGAERPCVGLGDLFFPPDGREPTLARKAREAQALAVCAGCPVIGECHDEACERNERWGIWGGLTERERRLMAEAHVRSTVSPSSGASATRRRPA